MDFRQSHQYQYDLEEALGYYLQIDKDLAIRFISELEDMESHLADFPEASPLTTEPPIRKFLLQDFPYRVRYAYENNTIFLLTLENMNQDLPL